MFDTTALSFTVREEIVVTGTNPEMADYDNQRGDVHGIAFVIQASNDHGDTCEMTLAITPLRGCDANHERAKAERFATALGARWLDKGKLPVGFDRWTEGRPVYGSPAYQAYGQADDLAWERDMDERY